MAYSTLARRSLQADPHQPRRRGPEQRTRSPESRIPSLRNSSPASCKSCWSFRSQIGKETWDFHIGDVAEDQEPQHVPESTVEYVADPPLHPRTILSPEKADIHTSRGERKGRTTTVFSVAAAKAQDPVQEATNTPRAVLKGILRMFTYFPGKKLSYWIAMVAFVACAAWVLNTLSFGPLIHAGSGTSLGQIGYARRSVSFLGNTLLVAISVMSMYEAILALPRIADLETPDLSSEVNNCWQKEQRLFPHAESLYADSGFQQAVLCLCLSIPFWILSFIAFFISRPRLTSDPLMLSITLFRCLLFPVCGLMGLREIQNEWYTPEPRVLGWWISILNILGGVGFMLQAILTFLSTDDQTGKVLYVWWAALCALVGGMAFLVGSLLLWYEAVNPQTVEHRPAKEVQAAFQSAMLVQEDGSGSLSQSEKDL